MKRTTKPGNTLVGTVVRYEQLESQYGPCWSVIIEVEANEHHAEYLAAVYLSHKVLLEKFKTLRPTVGERIGIKRLEDAEKGYARYVVVVDRPDAGMPDWDRLDVEATPF